MGEGRLTVGKIDTLEYRWSNVGIKGILVMFIILT